MVASAGISNEDSISQNALKWVVMFPWRQLCSAEDSPEQLLQMRAVLTDAFGAVQRELDTVCARGPRPPPTNTSCPSAEESPGRQLKDDRTVALLEKYSEMLLRIAEKKLDCN